MALVYRKTDKGIPEIETRANRLTPRLRTALIMVDARRNEVDLRALIGGQADEVLSGLKEQGFIEGMATAASRSPAPAVAPASPAAAGGRSWEERRRLAVRFLNDNLGPSAEQLVLKIEKSRDWEELKGHLEMGEHFLRSARGTSMARDFAAKFIEDPLP
jgi:hypothetical protein